MTDRAVKLLSPDGTYRVTLDTDTNGRSVATYTWDDSGTQDSMAPSDRPLDELVQWFRSFGWIDDTGSAGSVDKPAH